MALVNEYIIGFLFIPIKGGVSLPPKGWMLDEWTQDRLWDINGQKLYHNLLQTVPRREEKRFPTSWDLKTLGGDWRSKKNPARRVFPTIGVLQNGWWK